MIAAGEKVPPFSLVRYSEGPRAQFNAEPFTRDDLVAQSTVLVFYPFAFSSTCSDQLSLYDDLRDDFAAAGATLYAVSCDAIWSQRAFREKLGISIEQLSDFEPKGETCRAFGVYNPAGFAQRAVVIVGPDGTVRWSHQARSIDEIPGANLIFDALVIG